MSSPNTSATSLAEWLGIGAGSRSCVAIVGAGGKTTTTFALGRELATRGDRTIVTTTTKMGRDQTGGLTVVGVERAGIVRALEDHGSCLVVDESRTSDRKISGLTSEQVEALFGEYDAVRHVVIEADGARKNTVKAPGPHEPVIPGCCTHVIAVIGAMALNRVIEDQAHRPLRVAAAAGLNSYDRLTPEGAVRLLTDAERGSRKSVPGPAWYGVLVNQVTDAQRDAAHKVEAGLVALGVPVRLVDFNPVRAAADRIGHARR